MDESSLRTRMQQVIDVVSRDIGAIRTGRATSAIIENLLVSVYGGQQKLTIKELASITSPDPQTLLVDPWDKSITGEIRQGIMAANVGLNPVLDNEKIRVTLPALTTEDREKYVRLLSTKLESGRIMIRQVRADGMHDIKKSFEEKDLTEDDKFAAEKKLQGLTDEFIEKINEMGERKKTDLMQI